MKRNLSLLCAVTLVLSLTGCGGLALPGGGHSSSSDLGPSEVPAETAPTSTLSARIHWSLDYLWGSYTRLKAAIDPATDNMKRLYVAAQEMATAAHAGQWLKALGFYATARELVDDITTAKGF